MADAGQGQAENHRTAIAQNAPDKTTWQARESEGQGVDGIYLPNELGTIAQSQQIYIEQ